MICGENRAETGGIHPPTTLCIPGSQQTVADLSEARTLRLRLLCEITNNLVSDGELDDLIREAVAGARRVVPSEIAFVGLPDCEGYRLRVNACDSVGELTFDERQLDLFAEVLATRVFSSGKPWSGGAAELAWGNEPKSIEWAVSELGCISVLPLVLRDQTLGILALGRFGHNFYTADEVEFLAQLASQLAIAVENVAVREELRRLKSDYTDETLDLEGETGGKPCFKEIVGRSSALQRTLREVEVVAPTDSGVLILGETGTGKELIARAIHNLSDRRDRPFVKLNCAAIPSGLLESELFGHERGAFTGAIMRKAGRFEVADKGTLFLDEVGDIPLELQPKLLRVLQEHEFERLGSTHTQQVDVRVVAATHRDLKQMVEDGQFRSDLYYRLHVFPLSVPPLRERREDIPVLVRHFVDEYARSMKRRIESVPPQVMEALTTYQWPGNVRELQNFIERAVILSPGSVLRPPLAELKHSTIQEEPSSDLSTLEEMEREHVMRAVRASNWKIGGPDGAAARLGMKRTTLAYRIRKLNIPLRPQ